MDDSRKAKEFSERVFALLKRRDLLPWERCSCQCKTQAEDHATTCPVYLEYMEDWGAACMAVSDAMEGYDPRSAR